MKDKIIKVIEKNIKAHSIAIDYTVDEILALFNVSNSFYCQREIEMKTICDKQCKHCEEYYEPLKNDC